MTSIFDRSAENLAKRSISGAIGVQTADSPILDRMMSSPSRSSVEGLISHTRIPRSS